MRYAQYHPQDWVFRRLYFTRTILDTDQLVKPILQGCDRRKSASFDAEETAV
jgi:hypothetical protein